MELLDGGQHAIELVRSPRKRRLASLHVLERQHHPSFLALVECPEEPRSRRGVDGQRTDDPGLSPVEFRRFRVRLVRDGLDEDAPASRQHDPRGDAGREPAGLRLSRDDLAVERGLERGHDVLRQLGPVAARTARGGGNAQRRDLSSRSTSRCASRLAMSRRLSCASLPRASAISTFTRPFFQ